MSKSRIAGTIIVLLLMAAWTGFVCYLLFWIAGASIMFILGLTPRDLLLLALAFACFAYACHRPPSRIQVIPRGYGVYSIRQFFRW